MRRSHTRLAEGLLGLALVAGLILSAGAPAAGPARAAGKDARAATGGDWPLYGHDPSRTNDNPAETAIGTANAGQLVALWQQNIGGNGQASASGPSVVGGRVFVGSSVPRGDNFFAFDALSGAPAWSANLGYRNDCFNIGLGSTPAIAGNVVTVGGGDGAYYGLDAASGAQLWRNPLGVGASAFAWASPLVADGRTYIGVASYCDNPSVRGAVRALDPAAGTPLGEQYFVRPGHIGGGVWNSPALSPDGSTLVVATGEDNGGDTGPYLRALVTLDPVSLAISQTVQEGAEGNDEDWGTSPLVFHDAQGHELTGALHKNGIFYTYLLHNLPAGPVWQRATGVTIGMMPAYDAAFGTGGTLFWDAQGTLYAVDPATGLDRWAPVATGGAHGNLAIANGLIFLNGGAAGVKVIDESTGALLRSLVPAHAGPALTGVVVSHGVVYWLSGTMLNAWSLPGGPPAATPTPQPPTPTPRVPPTPTSGPGCVFSDVCPDAYFFTPVQYLVAHGVLSGYGDNTFRPYANTTRGQMVKIVVNAFGVPAYTPPVPTFADVPPEAPFYGPIETAVHAGLITGYADGTFRPNAAVTRGQLAKIVVAGAGWAPDTAGGPHFADVAPSDPFYAAIETAFQHGVAGGYADGTFRPGNSAIRGQIAKIVYLAVTAGLAR